MSKKKDEKKEAKPIEVELTETVVKYDFSQDELIEIGERVAELAGKLAVLEAEAKQIAKQYKADIEGVELQQNRLINFIREKFEMRKMGCFKVIDGLAKKVYFFRSDQIDLNVLKVHTIEEIRAGFPTAEIGVEFHPDPAKIRDARPSELQRPLPIPPADQISETVEGGEKVTTE